MIVALLIVVIAISTTFNAVTVALPKLFAERLADLTRSPALLGVIAACVYVFGAMTQYTIGKLLDRHSLKAVSLPLSFVLAPFLYFAATLSNLPLILVSIGIVMGAFGQVTVNDAMVGKYTSEEWRSRAYAVRYFVGFTAAGASVGLVAWLYQQGGFVTMLHAFAGAVPAGDRGGDHPADRDQGAGGAAELIAAQPSYRNADASAGDFGQRMRHVFQPGRQPRPADRAAEADAHRFRRRAAGGEGVAGDDADRGRAHVFDERGAIPQRGQFDPDVEAQRVAFVDSLRQDLRDQLLPRGGLAADEAQQRVGGAVLDPSRHQRHRERRGHHGGGAQRGRERPGRAGIGHHDIGGAKPGADAFGEARRHARSDRARSRQTAHGRAPE